MACPRRERYCNISYNIFEYLAFCRQLIPILHLGITLWISKHPPCLTQTPIGLLATAATWTLNLWGLRKASKYWVSLIYVHIKRNKISFCHFKIELTDSTPAILPNYSLAFNLRGMRLAEPSFANLRKEEGKEVHGVAFQMSRENMEKLDRYCYFVWILTTDYVEKLPSRQEGAYAKHDVTLIAYDGRHLNGFIYIKENASGGSVDTPTSQRYLDILIKGKTADVCIERVNLRF